jgi:hypothetical protein
MMGDTRPLSWYAAIKVGVSCSLLMLFIANLPHMYSL